MLGGWLSRPRVVLGEESRFVPPPDAMPVTLLTGFLGSGKTSLLNAILSDPQFADTAVIVNEFGTIPIDHELVHAGREQYVLTSAGCLCCTATSDIRSSLFELHEGREQGALPSFSRVIVETTGLADPAAIVNSLIPGGAPALGMRDHVVARQFRLANVITALDAISGEDALSNHMEGWKQLAFANDIILTKTDLIDADRHAWRERLAAINPSAVLHDRHADDFSLVKLIGSGTYDPTNKADDVIGWLAMEAMAGREHDHAHDPNRHGGIQALPLVHHTPLDPRAVRGFLDTLTSQRQSGLLRLKGVLALADDPARPLVVHAVQHKLYPSVRLADWPGDDTRSRLMLIGKDMPIGPIQASFDSLIPRSARRELLNNE